MTVRDLIAGTTCLLTIASLLAFTPALSWAQDADEESHLLTIRLHTVKPHERVAWESLMKERRDAEQAAGRVVRRVFERIRGPSDTFLIYHLDTEMTEDIPPIDLSPTWGQRLDSTVESSSTMTVRMFPNISANLDNWLTNDAELMIVRLRTTPPSRRQDYHDWQANELAPFHEKAGIVFRGGRLELGGNINTWVRFYVVDDFAAMTATNPALDTDEFRRIRARGDAISTTNVNYLYRYRAELSFLND